MPTAEMLALLSDLVQRIHPLEGEVWDAFSGIWQPFEAGRKEILTSEGEKERYLYFVLEGVQRAYALNEEGRDATLVFTYPYSFGGVLDAFLLQQPSRYWFETLTPSLFLRATFAQLEETMVRYHDVERLVRLGLTGAFSGVLTRQIELQSCSAEERFRILMKRSPHLLTMVPHKYLANYLGMDPTNFSKFLGKIRL